MVLHEIDVKMIELNIGNRPVSLKILLKREDDESVTESWIRLFFHLR